MVKSIKNINKKINIVLIVLIIISAIKILIYILLPFIYSNIIKWEFIDNEEMAVIGRKLFYNYIELCDEYDANDIKQVFHCTMGVGKSDIDQHKKTLENEKDVTIISIKKSINNAYKFEYLLGNKKKETIIKIYDNNRFKILSDTGFDE